MPEPIAGVLAPDDSLTLTLGTTTLTGSLTGDSITLEDNAGGIAATLTSVPEPATLSLLGLGLAGVGFMRKRKAN